MSLLAVHMSIADEAAERLGVPEVLRCRGAVLLGCTAPDRRVITRQPRQETHFFRLTEDGIGAGFDGLREAHPALAHGEGLDWASRAFLIGYLSHLAADEAWIVHVYRPFFGEDARLGADPARNILDRALQYDQERVILADHGRMDDWRSALRDELPALPEAFIPADTLRSWREFVSNVVTMRDGGWHEFSRFIVRFRSDPGLTETQVEGFLTNPESMFVRVFDKVPRDILASHRERSIDATIRMAREFLS